MLIVVFFLFTYKIPIDFLFAGKPKRDRNDDRNNKKSQRQYWRKTCWVSKVICQNNRLLPTYVRQFFVF